MSSLAEKYIKTAGDLNDLPLINPFLPFEKRVIHSFWAIACFGPIRLNPVILVDIGLVLAILHLRRIQEGRKIQVLSVKVQNNIFLTRLRVGDS